MIICRKHRFVFTRPMKVGSESAQIMLLNSGIVGEGDYHSGAAEVGVKLPFPVLPGLDTLKTRLTFAHATPSTLVSHGLLTDDDIANYTFVSIVRDPVRRYISAWAYEGGRAVKDLIEKVNDGYMPLCIGSFSPEIYFHHNGRRLKNIIAFNTDTLNQDIDRFVTLLGGSITAHALLNFSKLPHDMRGQHSDWLPKECVCKLEALLKSEIEFYTDIMSGR